MSNEQNTDVKPGASRAEEPFRWNGAELLIRLRIAPRASRDKVSDLLGDHLKISITAPPVDGKANVHLMKFITKQFGVAKLMVTVVSGTSGRDKTVCITDPRKLPDTFQIAQTTE